ncbi:ATP-binding cassette domain-containing protein [Escherichia coli]
MRRNLALTDPVTIEAEDLFITSPEGKTLAGPLNFTLRAGQRAVLVGRSRSGKSSLLNAPSGFLSYQGIATIQRDRITRFITNHGVNISSVGQNPQLLAATLRDNVPMARPDASEHEFQAALDNAWVSEFLPLLPQGVDTPVGDQAARLSVGQAHAWRWPVRY